MRHLYQPNQQKIIYGYYHVGKYGIMDMKVGCQEVMREQQKENNISIINLASTSYSSPNNITKKPNEISSNLCWLRSPIYRIVERFCYIAKNGSCAGADASMSLGIAPGFSI